MGKSVKEMLNSMDSVEFSHWIAYERVVGPLDSRWAADVQASTHEELQTIAYLLSQAHFTDKNHRKGPIEKPERVPRPHEWNKEKPHSAAEDLGDEEEWLPLTEDELLDVNIDTTETGEGE